jgi:hypothetical protein
MTVRFITIPISFALLCSLALNNPANAQAGSTGGTLGKTEKSISGERQEENPAPRATPRPAKPAAPAAATANYIGCFHDQCCDAGTVGRDISGLKVSDRNMTSARCIAICRGQGFAYAAVQYATECFCGNSYGHNGMADNCNMPCGGNPSEMCGGLLANSVYGLRGSR